MKIDTVEQLAHSVARRRIRAWMREERPYADSKWPTEDEHLVLSGDTAFSWDHWVEQYIARAAVVGLDTERGRVALAKAIMTATRVLEEAIVQHGSLPRGGTPS